VQQLFSAISLNGRAVSMEEILVIDDSEQICNLLAEYVLPELGYRPVVAHTGRQGLQRLRARLPDLILLDLQPPILAASICYA